MIQKSQAIKVSSGINMTLFVIADPIVRMVKQGTLKVTELTVRDVNEDTIKLSLFGSQADGIINGSTIKVKNANTNDFRNEISLAIPRWGSVELVQ